MQLEDRGGFSLFLYSRNQTQGSFPAHRERNRCHLPLDAVIRGTQLKNDEAVDYFFIVRTYHIILMART